MTGEPIVTAIIPTLDRPALLKRSIRSVQGQTTERIAVVVVDDSNSDENEQLVRTMSEGDPRIRYVRSPHRLGIRRAFMAGLALAETPYVCFLGDDDYLLPDFHLAAVEVLEGDPEAVLAAGGLILTRDDGSISYTLDGWSRFGRVEPQVAVGRLLSSMTAAWHAVLFRRDSVAACFTEEPLELAFDMLIMLELTSQHPSWILPQPFAVQRVGSETFSGSAMPDDTLSDWKHIESIFRRDIAPGLGDGAQAAIDAMEAGVRRVAFDTAELALLRPSTASDPASLGARDRSPAGSA